jgi:hypothetical protein
MNKELLWAPHPRPLRGEEGMYALRSSAGGGVSRIESGGRCDLWSANVSGVLLARSPADGWPTGPAQADHKKALTGSILYVT